MADVRDTAQLHAITGRRPATIRALCRDLRGPDGYAWPGALDRLDEHPGGEVVGLTSGQAERYLGIPAITVRRWYQEGDLHPVDIDDRDARLYSPEDLLRLRDRPQPRDEAGRWTAS